MVFYASILLAPSCLSHIKLHIVGKPWFSAVSWSDPNMVISFVPAANHENREGRFHPAASCDWLLQISDNVIGSDMSRALPVSVARSQAVTWSQRPGEMAVSLRIVARSNELIRELICPSCAGTGLQVIYRADESRVLQRFASQVQSVPQKCLYIHTHAQWMTPAVMFWCGCAHGARGGTDMQPPEKK